MTAAEGGRGADNGHVVGRMGTSFPRLVVCRWRENRPRAAHRRLTLGRLTLGRERDADRPGAGQPGGGVRWCDSVMT